MVYSQAIAKNEHHPLMSNTPLTVTELTARIKQVLEQGFAQVEVTGEISRLTTPASGHLYFTIKDAHAAISAVVWRSAATRLKNRPKDGQEYVFIGHLSVYEPRGTYQLIITRIEPIGAGRLAAEFERRKTFFAEKGWFDAQHKQNIPALPLHIGIVTSQSAAAFEDVKKVLKTRPSWLKISLSSAVVQGESAPDSITQAIQRLHQLNNTPDVILLVRGGGSIEDLWCFNDERVIKAVFKATIPIISGVGHEIDTTLTDLVADIRAATPSNAAELCCPSRDELYPKVIRLKQRLTQAVKSYQDAKNWSVERVSNKFQQLFRQQLQQKHLQVRHLKSSLQQLEPSQSLRQNMQRFYHRKQKLLSSGQRITTSPQQSVEHQHHQLHSSFQRLLHQRREQWQKNHEQLFAMNPRHVLKRGYAMTTDAQGCIVSSIKRLQSGDMLHLHFQDGVAQSTITHTKSKEQL